MSLFNITVPRAPASPEANSRTNILGPNLARYATKAPELQSRVCENPAQIERN